MNDEKPSEPKRPDGRPLDGGLGPTETVRGGFLEPPLSARQLHGDNASPSWKAPREKRGISNAAPIAIIVLVAVVVLIALRVVGVI